VQRDWMDHWIVLPLIEMRRNDIADICRRFHVSRLDVFGSAARGSDFDPARSDVDLLVTYQSTIPRPTLEEYFEFREQLEALFGRSVDLVMAGAVRNPYVRADIERSRELVYEA
jgi:predicted nucleotidyltransferase